MKKAIIKPTLAVVAVAASCFGAWKAYDAYGSVDNSLMMQNIEALTQNTNLEGESYILVPLADGPCYGLEPTGKTQQNNQGAYQQEMMWRQKGSWQSCKRKEKKKNEQSTCAPHYCKNSTAFQKGQLPTPATIWVP